MHVLPAKAQNNCARYPSAPGSNLGRPACNTDSLRRPARLACATPPARSDAAATVRACASPRSGSWPRSHWPGPAWPARWPAAARDARRAKPARGEASASAPAARGVLAVATKNTTRLGGADPAIDAAAVAQVVYPGLTPATRPQAVVLVDEHQWPVALSAASLASAPLGAPILYAEGNELPAVSERALRAMHPVGAPALGGAQVIRIGTTAELPSGYTLAHDPRERRSAGHGRAHAEHVRGGHRRRRSASRDRRGVRRAARAADAGGGAVGRERRTDPVRSARARARGSRQARCASCAAPRSTSLRRRRSERAPTPSSPGWERSCVSPAPRLPAKPRAPTKAKNPLPTRSRCRASGAERSAGASTKRVTGWCSRTPRARSTRRRRRRCPPTATTRRCFCCASAGRCRRPLTHYLSDIEPGYTAAAPPVREVYNHGWLIGDEAAISALAQAELDAVLEIAPRQPSAAEQSVAAAE